MNEYLTDLSFLEKGQPWPPPSEGERLDTYAANRLLWQGRHQDVFRDWARLLREDLGTELLLILNWHRRLSKLWADLLLGDPPTLSVTGGDEEGQAWLQDFLRRSRLVSTAYEVALDISRYGDGLFKAALVGGEAKIYAQPPQYWFPVVSPTNIRKVLAHVIAWQGVGRPRGYVNPQPLLWAEIHQPGLYERRVYLLRPTGDEARRKYVIADWLVDHPDTAFPQETGVEEPLIVQAVGVRASDELYGADDYSDLETLIQEMEIRLGQVSRILDKHADPGMYGPELALERDPYTGIEHFRGGGKYIPVGEGESPPGYMIWNGNLEGAFREIEELKDQLYLISETSPAVFGLMKQGLAESGSALRRLLFAPLKKVNRLRMHFDPALREIVLIANRLEALHSDAPTLEGLNIIWRDGLPVDDGEESQVLLNLRNAGVISRHEAIRERTGWNNADVEAEVNRIEAENATGAANNSTDTNPQTNQTSDGGASGPLESGTTSAT
ncbi:phage portal protein [Meiothermus granaticius]|uniref:Phage portal protein, SPP1 Gp6-like n=1 Tax=Meiothermus granaticius NBRC 107808 TaxID=1227551 RepID=A0A399FFE9_9DEIN|nr:phage portal protein [Meiothermus granaticius]RIH94002.1 Phage portal protein, SPP1 Gp6-like [Meiothermus granaticius NBRC 107808]GEM88169.1 hypothetical protein MGR01S_27940 [Meiothermus granaticius NBRC 107808]